MTGLILDPTYAPMLPFERGSGTAYAPLGDVPALVELSAPDTGPSFMGVESYEVTEFTQSGILFVPRGTDLHAGDRFTYQDRKYVLMGARNWDLDHPLTGDDFGWMTFAIEVDPRQLMADLLALRGQQITLIPAVGVVTEKPSGGKDYSAATPRSPQTFVLYNTKGLDGREAAQTDRSTVRKFAFQLLGAADAQIAIGDEWEDDVAKYIVESIDKTKPYNVEALVTGYLKVQGHGFGG